jgi:hypothetical protein
MLFKTQPPYAASGIFKPEISRKDQELSGIKSTIGLMTYQRCLAGLLKPMTRY